MNRNFRSFDRKIPRKQVFLGVLSEFLTKTHQPGTTIQCFCSEGFGNPTMKRRKMSKFSKIWPTLWFVKVYRRLKRWLGL